MNILFLTNSKGGVQTFTKEIAERIHNRGNNVEIIYLEPLDIIHPSQYIKQILQKYDVVHSNFAVYSLITSFLKLTKKTPYIYTNHGIPQPNLEKGIYNKTKYTIELKLLDYHLHHSKFTVAPSKFIHNYLKSRFNIESRVIYHGVDLKKFRPHEKYSIKQKLDLSNKKVLLSVQKLHPYKDPLTLIEAFHILTKHNNNLKLVLIGSGELQKEVINQIHNFNLQDSVRLILHVPEDQLIEYYNAADIFVHTAINEAFGLVITQAMASGLPVIAPRSGSCYELLHNRDVLFETGDSIDLSERLEEIISDEEKARQLGKENRINAMRDFSWEKTTNDYVKTYIDCLR